MTITIGMVIFSIICGLGLTAGITATVYSQSWIQQYEYSQIGDSDMRMDYVLNEMSCQTIILSTELQLTSEKIPLKPIEVSADGNTALTPYEDWIEAETLEECWDTCSPLMEGYEPEPDHYFIHVPFGDDGWMFFDGLDELVQECRRL